MAYLPSPILNVTSDTTLTSSMEYVRVDATSSNVTITLPLANTYPPGTAKTMLIKRIDSSANTVTVQIQGSDTLDGGASTTHEALVAKEYMPNGVSAWAIA